MVAVGLAHCRQFLIDDAPGLVPLDLLEDGCAVGVDTTAGHRLAQPVGILVELLQRRSLRTDETVGEHVGPVAADPLHLLGDDLDLEAAGGLTERAGAKDGAVGCVGHDVIVARRSGPQ